MDKKKCWRKKAREYLAIAFGGKCTICGYNKTIAALDYHHLNPSEKDFSLSVAMKNGGAWAKIVAEAKKCTIVCCRCHREIHAGITKLPCVYAIFNEEYNDVIKLKEKEYDNCKICTAEKRKSLDFCSLKCAHESQKKFIVSKNDLEILIQEKPYETIGKMFGVSGNAIKKRCKSFGIILPERRGYWQKLTSQIP